MFVEFAIGVLLFITVNADDRESNMVFNCKSNEVEEDAEEVSLQPFESADSDSSDGASASEPNKDFFSAINWQEANARSSTNKDSFDDSDDDFGNLRSDGDNTAGHASSQAHDFFSKREGVETSAQGEIDLFNLKSASSEGMDERLFNFEDSDSSEEEPVISKKTVNVDLLNLGSNIKTEPNKDMQGGTVKSNHVAVTDDMGVDLLNLSPGKIVTRRHKHSSLRLDFRPIPPRRSVECSTNKITCYAS